ncbi:DHHW protein [Halobacillus karajensis]|uniref:DHHW family protein n=1 Tax=Halobacillus karajensis TaxID=195088 RepID=UPI0008A7727E|nr:DHHW family protein [Halobacillus karajensis]SEH44318.1 DHHW protein [Halobacillus karajensis]
MKKLTNLFISISFIGFIIGIGIFAGVTPAKETSYIENRSLAPPPSLEKGKFVNGGFMEDFESFFTDQFPLRDTWLKAYLNTQEALGKTFLLGYYVSEENWITKEPDHSFPADALTDGAEKVTSLHHTLKEKGIELYYINTPHKVSNMQFLLPDYIERGSYDRVRHHFLTSLNKNIPKLDMVDLFNETFTHKEMKELFYKTDHHWNAQGAFHGYTWISEWLDSERDSFTLQPDRLNKDHFQKQCLPGKDFVGSYNRQLYLSVETKEKKCAYFPTNHSYEDFVVEANGKVVDYESVFGRAFHTNEKRVYYSTLYTKDLRELKITNPALKGQGEKALVIKDSYANALSFLLAEQFYETTYYDPRYNKDRALIDYIENHDFDLVILMYNDPASDGAIYEFGKPIEP